MEIRFIPARWFTPGSDRSIDWLVIHSIEGPETPGAAENCARDFANRPRAKAASAHYCIDSDSIVQCVRDRDVAWAAPGANRSGLHFEHAGRALQTREQWLDSYGRGMLSLSARLAAEKAAQHGIPLAWLTPQDLQAGKRGFTSHHNVTLAFRKGSHTDPGPGFPAGAYMELVRGFAAQPPAAAPLFRCSLERSPAAESLQRFLNAHLPAARQLRTDGIAGPLTCMAFEALFGLRLSGDSRAER